MGDLPEGEPLIVPLAVPLLAGPSTMATLLLLVRSEPGRLVDG
jgi:multiple antibiotic resistance protein